MKIFVNPSQLYELELNFVGTYVSYYMSQTNDNNERKELLRRFVETVNPKQYKVYSDFIDQLDEEGKNEFFNELINKGIPIEQKPFFGNIDLDKMTKLYEEFPDVKEFKFKDIKTPLIMGYMYMLVLKHNPYGKLSVRSTSFNNLMDFPAKCKSYKEHKALYSNTPVRLGKNLPLIIVIL